MPTVKETGKSSKADGLEVREKAWQESLEKREFLSPSRDEIGEWYYRSQKSELKEDMAACRRALGSEANFERLQQPVRSSWQEQCVHFQGKLDLRVLEWSEQGRELLGLIKEYCNKLSEYSELKEQSPSGPGFSRHWIKSTELREAQEELERKQDELEKLADSFLDQHPSGINTGWTHVLRRSPLRRLVRWNSQNAKDLVETLIARALEPR